MARATGPLALFLILALSLAGCLGGPGGEPPADETGDRSKVPACPPVPPAEQRVATAQEVTCPGHYAILAEGSGRAFEASWEVGEWWEFVVIRSADDACLQLYRETVVNATERAGVAVYVLQFGLMDCERAPHGEGSEFLRTRGALQVFHEDTGYRNHEVPPGAQEGTRWATVDNANRFATGHLGFETDYAFGGNGTPAWHVTMSRAGYDERHQWWGVEAGHMLYEETYDGQGELRSVRQLVASSRGIGVPAS